MKIFVPSIVLTLLALEPIARADPLDQWTWRNSGTMQLYGIASGNNEFVIGGDITITSADGVSWIEQPLSTNQIQVVIFAKNQFVALGWQTAPPFDVSTASIFTSADATNWTSRSYGTFNALAYGQDRVVAVGYGGGISVSADGITWTAQTSGTSNSLQGVAYGNGQFVAIGDFGTILTSPDGITWTVRTTETTNRLWNVAYGNKRFVVVGDGVVLTSVDSVTWSVHAGLDEAAVAKIAFGISQFVVANGYDVLTSVDGINWTPQHLGHSFQDVAYVSDRFVAVGVGGTIFTSSDAVAWTSHSPFIANAVGLLKGIAYGIGKFIAVGSEFDSIPPFYTHGTILTSPDGAAWTKQDPGPVLGLSGVAHGNGRLVTVGYGVDSYGTGFNSVILRSDNGIAWTPQRSLVAEALYGVGYGNDLFVAVGLQDGVESGGLILTSPDGVTWTMRASGTTNGLCSVAYGNRLFVAVGGRQTSWGNPGTVVTSPDGVVWTSQNIDPQNSFAGVAYGNNLFVGAGKSDFGGAILASPDGTNWTRVFASDEFMTSVAFGNGHFVAVGGGVIPDWTRIVTSCDGTNWVKSLARGRNLLNGVDFANNSFTAVGDAGAIIHSGILQSATILGSVDLSSDRMLRMTLVGPAGQRWQIQESTNLTDWAPVTNVGLTGPSAQIALPLEPNSLGRFYRASKP